jgi:hypothetical protein
MQFKQLRAAALATTAVMGLALIPSSTQAANNAAMTASIEAVDAVSVTNLNNMNFGKWLLNYDTNDIVLTMDPLTSVVTPTTTAPSTAAQLSGTSRSGRMAVELPSGIEQYVLDMTVSTITDFADTAYTLTSLSYATATEAVATITADGTTTHPVTVIHGGATSDEVVYFGGVITVSGAVTPGVDNDATFTATFNY